MSTGSAIRANDGSGLNIATRTATEDAVTKHFQRVHIADPTTPTQELAIDSSGFAKVINQANSGVDIGDVTINNASGASAVNIQDGGNSITVDGTFFQSTQPISIADGSDTTLGSKADAKSTATDTTSVSVMSVLKQISASVQAPPSQAVTNAGTFATQAAQSGTWNISNVSGTVSLPTGAATAAKQPALGTAGTASLDVITVQGIASMTALKVDGSAVTQPVSAASLPLPTGASTAAKQPALGTAGTPSADVITVQGNASGTPIPVSGSFSASFGTATSGGYTIKHLVSAGSTNATSVKASAGQVYGWKIFNAAAYPIYVKFHNTAGTPTAGSGVVDVIGVQAGTRACEFNTHGIAYGTGIGITVVKDITDAGTTAVLASDCVLDIYYA